MLLQVPTRQTTTCRNSPEPTQPQPHLTSPNLSYRGVHCGQGRERSLRRQRCDMNSKTHPSLWKGSTNPVWRSGCTAGLLLAQLLCKKYFADPWVQQSQQTRHQSQKARARAGGMKAKGAGPGSGRGCCVVPPHPVHYLFLHRHH